MNNLPDLSNIFKVEVNTQDLYDLLLDMQNKIEQLEEKVSQLENKK